jgi:hypothetical protein
MPGHHRKPASKADPGGSGASATDRDIVRVLFQHAAFANIGIDEADLDPINWSEAARIIGSSQEILGLDSAGYRTLSSFLGNAPDREAAEMIRETIDRWVRTHWLCCVSIRRLFAWATDVPREPGHFRF